MNKSMTLHLVADKSTRSPFLHSLVAQESINNRSPKTAAETNVLMTDSRSHTNTDLLVKRTRSSGLTSTFSDLLATRAVRKRKLVYRGALDETVRREVPDGAVNAPRPAGRALPHRIATGNGCYAEVNSTCCF